MVRNIAMLSMPLMVIAFGCALRDPQVEFAAEDIAPFENVSTQIEYPDVESNNADDVATMPGPILITEDDPPPFRPITLQQAIENALTHADVLRDLGGLVLRSPENVRTVHGPAIVETAPIRGVDAALSEFDAQLEAGLYFEKNDRALNNSFFGGGTRLLRQDLHAYRAQISKRTAMGTEFSLRHLVDYDHNNSPGNDVPNKPWVTQLEGEFRQPLFQGAGVDFNRIAGPAGVPGRYTGVLLARIDTDVSLSDFEIGVRDMIRDVENAYWELYFAYRDLDAKIKARDRALRTWRRVHSLYVNERKGGEAEKEAQAREQYFRLQEEVQNALSGRKLERTRPDTFRGTGGVYATERKLRQMIGMQINDGHLLRPADEPIMAKVSFDWGEILVESLIRRAELRRQKWAIRRSELELIAARNFLLPRVDAIGRYRFRGLGRSLLDPNGNSPDPFDNAYGNMTSGKFQEWQLGVEFSAPIGFRRAHANVRHVELTLARHRALLAEQERSVAHDLSAAIAEANRAYTVAQSNYNRRGAANQQLQALEAIYDRADEVEKTRLLDLLLDAQRRLADSESRYYRSMVEYTLAIRDVHLEKGSLLDYCEVYLAEGPWPGKAYHDAAKRDRWRREPHLIDYTLRGPRVVSRGPYAQDTVPASEPLRRLPTVGEPMVDEQALREERIASPANDAAGRPIY